MNDLKLPTPITGSVRKQVSMHPEHLVKMSFFDHLQLPAIIKAVHGGVSLSAWLRSSEQKIPDLISRYGGVLFRGFNVKSVDDFNSGVVAISGKPLEYLERSSPRQNVLDNVYTSTEHPADQEIFPHNEQSYNLTVPLKIFFYCETPALTGGATPLTDIRALTRTLCPKIKDRFNQKKYMYMRNYSPGVGITWQEAFQTDKREVVEAYCRSQEIHCEWLSNDRLRTRQIRDAMIVNPLTGELLWFNHITFFNVRTLAINVQQNLAASFATADLPSNTYYGDGEPIEPEVLETLRAAYRAHTTQFSWEAGDVLALDNLSIAHSRASFTGPRKVFVAMAESFTYGC